MKRLRELDFLRGVAIVLVLLRHQYLFSYTQRMGWIGVDLFFVLSGFLVSGLLFKEYIKFGDIKAGKFLIRRGFKIYPIYFLFYPLFLLPLWYDNKLYLPGIVSELFFYQNYVSTFGYANGASWSLAIEEHFYFGVTLLIWVAIHKKWITLNILTKTYRVELILGLVMFTCLLLRLYNNTFLPDLHDYNFTMSHLRIDSLMAGVFFAVMYYFKRETLNKFIHSNKIILFIIMIIGVCWTPFLDPHTTYFVKTFGFLALYVSFSILLGFFVLLPKINFYLDKILGSFFVNTVSKIGYCSYSIYIIHALVNTLFERYCKAYDPGLHRFAAFAITSAISISIGMIMTHFIEDYFLKIRDKKFPNRVISSLTS